MLKIEIDREDLRQFMLLARKRQDELRRVQEDEPGFEKARQLDYLIEKLKHKYISHL